MKKTAAELARDALKLAILQNGCDMLLTGEELRKCEAAIVAIDADLAQAVEPVAWVNSSELITFEIDRSNYPGGGVNSVATARYMKSDFCNSPLFAVPQEPAAPDVNAELLEACKAIVAWDDAENNAPEYASDDGAHWRMRQLLCGDAFDKARAAIVKAGGAA